MKANIRAAIDQISKNIDAGESEEPATNLEKVLDLIDGAGAVNLEGECASTLLALNETKEIAALDARITNHKLQRIAEKSLADTAESLDEHVDSLIKLATLKLLVPPFVSIVKCEQARRLLQAGTQSQTQAETKFIDAVREMVTNTRSFVASEVEEIVTAKFNFLIWKSSCCVQLQTSIKSLFEELRADATIIRGMLLDLEHLCKPANVAECISTMRGWAGHKDLMPVLKRFQGASGRGVKHFDVMIATLGCAGIFTPGPEMNGLDGVELPLAPGEQGRAKKKAYKELQQDFLKLRQSARLQLSLRSASIIIHSKDTASLASFEKDIKPLKIVLPKAIKDKLAELKK